jgi:hypothetical protein
MHRRRGCCGVAVGLDGAICPAGPIPDGVGPEKFAVLAANFSEMWSILARMLGRRVEDCVPSRHVTTSTADRERNTPALTKEERP